MPAARCGTTRAPTPRAARARVRGCAARRHIRRAVTAATCDRACKNTQRPEAHRAKRVHVASIVTHESDSNKHARGRAHSRSRSRSRSRRTRASLASRATQLVSDAACIERAYAKRASRSATLEVRIRHNSRTHAFTSESIFGRVGFDGHANRTTVGPAFGVAVRLSRHRAPFERSRRTVPRAAHLGFAAEGLAQSPGSSSTKSQFSSARTPGLLADRRSSLNSQTNFPSPEAHQKRASSLQTPPSLR